MKIHPAYTYLWKCQKKKGRKLPINFPSFAIMPSTCVPECSGTQKLMVIAAQLQQQSFPTKIKICGS